MIIKRFFGSIDPKEMLNFNKVRNWWQPNGSMEVLKIYNNYRVDYIIKKVIQNQMG